MYWITVRMHTKPNVQTLRRSVGNGFLSIESGKRGNAPRFITYSKDACVFNSNEDQQEAGNGRLDN
jgi:hypothetical protein